MREAERRPTDRLARRAFLWGGISSSLLLLCAPDTVFYALSPAAYALFFAGMIAAIPAYSGAASLRLLRIPPLLCLGRIRYGLYVWHFPILWLTSGRLVNLPAWLPRGSDRICNFIALVALTVLVSALSWRFFEQPLNSLKRRFPYRAARPKAIA